MLVPFLKSPLMPSRAKSHFKAEIILLDRKSFRQTFKIALVVFRGGALIISSSHRARLDECILGVNDAVRSLMQKSLGFPTDTSKRRRFFCRQKVYPCQFFCTELIFHFTNINPNIFISLLLIIILFSSLMGRLGTNDLPSLDSSRKFYLKIALILSIEIVVLTQREPVCTASTMLALEKHLNISIPQVR